jgi:hypothetical protein
MVVPPLPPAWFWVTPEPSPRKTTKANMPATREASPQGRTTSTPLTTPAQGPGKPARGHLTVRFDLPAGFAR